ncbi:hypothetical protein MY10362_007626 [Beauveria mimosiformis]
MPTEKQSSRFNHLPRAATGALQCPVTGQRLLSLAQYNKGSAFPNNERKEFKLHGLLPPKIQTLEEQVDRAYQQYSSCGDDLAKNTFMASMKAQNEVLYYKDSIEQSLAANDNAEDIDYIVVSDGEENEELLKNELYLGLQERRDFGLQNARRILDRYQSEIACFNDDIQGTGCVTLAAMLAAVQISDVGISDVRVVIFGSGTAGMGIADQLADAIVTEADKSKEDARKQIWCIDQSGLLLKSQGNALNPAQVPFARDNDEWPADKKHDLLSVIKQAKPHVLIGTSTKPNAFDQEIVREMAKHVERPIIFPLSNPTRLHEAKPSDLLNWTDGKALVATGSPFPPVEHEGRKYDIGNRLVSKKMLVAAVEALKAKSPALEDPTRGLLPDIEDVRDVSVEIAAGVIRCAMEEGLAQEEGIPGDGEELKEWIRAQMWDAIYRPLAKQ